MRLFWIMFGIALMLTGGWLVSRRGKTAAPPTPMTASAPAPIPNPAPVIDARPKPPQGVPQPEPIRSPNPEPTKTAADEAAAAPSQIAKDEPKDPTPPATPPDAIEDSNPVPAPPAQKKDAPVPTPEMTGTIAAQLDALLGTGGAEPGAQPPASDPASASSGAALNPAPQSASAQVAPAAGGAPTLEPRDDGTTLVDGRYLIKGKGTEDDPYRVSWEMLVSAEETYKPRLGQKVLPGRVKMLDGKWVRVSGFVAFPIMAQSPDEMLMMLNQWDGCCIGLPPTPYDAVEVRLKKGAVGDERLRTSGTVSGVLHVDPYLVKDWLVSLYLMDNAVLTDAAGTKDPEQHAPPK